MFMLLSLPSLVFIPNCFVLIVRVPLMYSFLIFFFLVTPIANLNILISATSITSFCFFVTVIVSSSPHTTASLSNVLYTFSFTLAGSLQLEIIPNTFLHPFHHACTLFLPHSHNYHFLAPLISNSYISCGQCGRVSAAWLSCRQRGQVVKVPGS